MYLVRSAALQGFEALVSRFGANPSVLLAEHNLSSALLRQPDAYLAYPRVAELMEQAAIVCGCPWFGFELSNGQSDSVLSELVLRAAQEPTLAKAIDLMLSYVHLHASGIITQQRVAANNAERWQLALAFDFTSARGTTQLMQLSLGVLYRSLVDLCGGTPEQYQIRVKQPRHTKPYDGTGVQGYPPIAFSSAFDLVEFPVAWMTRVPRRDEQHLSDHLQRRLDYLEAVYPNDLLLQLRYAISNLLPSGECSLNRCASVLGVHPRLLQKRLQQSGLSYSSVLRETRQQIALQHLQDSSISLTDLALNLGFAELSVFSRRFKTWQGMSPQEWRRRWREQSL
ncbi:AraC family transcriptional regulator [Aestuariirhabdus sp. Z084]|uniref:helix-turn-helix transcriptional regulator n=1 Tax=Aestuariirhabdus haliotis TaxID=2918751 RepID=UPI00201B3F8E|nr:AraC family transcriptional regulator [Aestuariirhabdus haliotis]MCL6415821.1 AraC family transcriptional regulator [Aestuariirhabdus haliotis]MCL6419877.1 AraC family transcriptional regulator [Aestuariirhabdus haliotis]